MNRARTLLPRWMHRLYAWVFGCFWAPCPVCGYWRGGHEADAFAGVLCGETAGGGEGVCRRCVAEANARNEARFGVLWSGVRYENVS